MIYKTVFLVLLATRAFCQLNLLGLDINLLGSKNKDEARLSTQKPVTNNLIGVDLDLLNIGNNKKNPQSGQQPSSTTSKPAVSDNQSACAESTTILSSGAKICKGQLIFEEKFDGYFLDKNKWDVEQYIPIIKGPDYEFVSYQNIDETYSLSDGSLVITPVALKNEADVRGILDLRNGCTSKIADECYFQQSSSFILPPVKSAKVTSKFAFTYGKIEVTAKLPRGDWIYPQIQLVPRRKEKEGVKIWIAYSRGNNNLIGLKNDEGSRLLFGGPVIAPEEPERSRFTRQRASVEPYGNATHVYTLIWEPGLMTLLYDGEEYGKVPIDEDDDRFFPFSREYYITLGVGVGGVNDFPDNYISNPPKPWKNMDRQQIRDFFSNRSEWLSTWHSSALKIDSVKIWAV